MGRKVLSFRATAAEGEKLGFLADAAFAKPDIRKALEERGVKYAIRILANPNMDLTAIILRCRIRPTWSTKRGILGHVIRVGGVFCAMFWGLAREAYKGLTGGK